MQEIRVTKGNGIAVLEQTDTAGNKIDMIVGTKQFAEIVQFLTHPKLDRFRAKDSGNDEVVVSYSNTSGEFRITQNDVTIVGNRNSENCGFSGVTLWMHQTSESS